MNQLLSWMIFLPAVGAGLILLLPQARLARPLGVLISAVVAAMGLMLWFNFDTQALGPQFGIKQPWLPDLGISFDVALDGLNLPLVVFTALLTPLAFLGTWSLPADATNSMQKRMTALVLLMECGALGTFLSQDLFLFYVFWEVILIPAYLLIGMYGGADRVKTTLQFFIYTFAGSLLMLVGIAWMIYAQKSTTGVFSASIADLQNLRFAFDPASGWGGLLSAQGLLFAAFAAAFFVKSPLVPFHAWLPSTYTQAPTLVTIYLAAVLSKMGTYGILKILLPLFPEAARAFGPTLMWLAAIGIVYGALLAIAQKNLKTAIAYSSLSHVSYILLGLFSLTPSGMNGALLQMVNHGIAITGLFLLVGHLEKSRGSLELSAFGGLAKTTPVLATSFMMMVLSSVALPGTNGFVGEFMVLVSSFRVESGATILAATGMVLGAVYMLNLYQRTMFGATEGNTAAVSWSDLSVKEIVVMAVLSTAVVGIGVAPQGYLDRSKLAIEATVKHISPEPTQPDQSGRVSTF
ncbi:complex I subunit 4 family protein [Oligoflexus tunisiensis]|uniref:complex I subunit 4 family protein n=1 Tax=Oligoflexus tunisiensis TaxID=708132 RepID=UPI000A9EECF8|nr:NADH-quinone oxidoreductase subunit M [Oligoflexus tunisiensis]